MGARGKGCEKCKSRRLKCDEATPACHRCQKAGLTCPGYESIFLDETSRVKRAAQAQQSNVSLWSHKQRYHAHKLRPNSSPQGLTFNAPTGNLSLIAFKNSITISFLATKMFEGRSPYGINGRASNTLVVSTEGWWLYEMAKVPQKSLDALAFMYFGRVHHSKEIETVALKSYGESLSKLRTDLINPGSVFTFETLAAMTALCFYEVRLSLPCHHGLVC